MLISLTLAFLAQTPQTSPTLEWTAPQSQPTPVVSAADEAAPVANSLSVGTLQFSSAGTCPGVMDFRVNGGAPGNICRIIYAVGPGSFAIPSGPCAGVVTGLDATATLYAPSFTFTTGGFVTFSATVPAAVCGYSAQAIEIATCMLSNVITL